MILPIFAYGQPVLKKKAQPITSEYPDLEALIANMWETMYHANGVGLAAPQIGLGIRLFVVDTLQIAEKEKETSETGIKKVFINAEILDESGALCAYEEGCLSIPDIRGDVDRLPDIRLRYCDEQFQVREEVFNGFNARVIQHEYDHIDGILFVDRLKPLKKRLIQRKLDAIKMGKVQADYKMKFAFK
jgi:peptide deformylase